MSGFFFLQARTRLEPFTTDCTNLGAVHDFMNTYFAIGIVRGFDDLSDC